MGEGETERYKTCVILGFYQDVDVTRIWFSVFSLVRERLGFSSCEASKMLTLHASGLGFGVQDLGYRV